jgi:hypothetical protein
MWRGAMGGYGSGERRDAKPTTGQALRLDVRWLARTGLFQQTGASWRPVHWTTRNGASAGAITVGYCAQRPEELILRYRLSTVDDAAGTAVREAIQLERTPCHYGGERVWCHCPGCGRRKVVLYGWAGGVGA